MFSSRWVQIPKECKQCKIYIYRVFYLTLHFQCTKHESRPNFISVFPTFKILNILEVQIVSSKVCKCLGVPDHLYNKAPESFFTYIQEIKASSCRPMPSQ